MLVQNTLRCLTIHGSDVEWFVLRNATTISFHFRDAAATTESPTVNVNIEDSSDSDGSSGKKKKTFRFKKALTDKELDELSGKKFSLNAERKISWAIELFRDWKTERMKDPECLTEIMWCSLEDKTLTKSHLCRTLCSFVNEVRRKDSQEYPGKTLYDLVLCVQFYLEQKGIFWKLIDDQEFVRLKFTLDNLMKKRCAERLGGTLSSDPITFEQEEVLWEKGILGEQSPDQLRNTVLYLLGISFALRGG